MDFTNFFFGNTKEPTPDVIGNSLRFRNNGTATVYLHNPDLNFLGDQTYTLSYWLKKGAGNDWTDMTIDIFNNDTTPGGTPGAGVHHSWTGGLSMYSGSGFARNYSGNPEFRDFNGWYHFCHARNATGWQTWVNGVTIGICEISDLDGAGGTKIMNPWGGGQMQYSATVAEYYCIDGQYLTADNFGMFDNNNVWVPIEADFAFGQTRYSNFLTAEGGFVADSGANAGSANYAFNGNLDQRATTNDGNSVVTFAPVPAIDFTDGVEVMVRSDSIASLNGAAAVNTNAGESQVWTELATGAGSINTITAQARNGSATAVYGFRINPGTATEQILLNPYQWSSEVNLLGSGSEGGFASSPTLMFDGNTATTCDAASANQSIAWQPSTPITYNQRVEVFTPGAADTNILYLYSEGVAIVDGINNLSGEWTTLIEGSGTFDDLRIYGASGVASQCAGIRIDGKVYIDGANPSYGPNGWYLNFKDPSNPGKDFSGNGNDFTPTGFDTYQVPKTGFYVNENTQYFDTATGTFPNGGTPYITDIVCPSGNGELVTGVPPRYASAMFDGDISGTFGEGTAYIHRGNGDNMENFNFDLRDFVDEGINEVIIYVTFNQQDTADSGYSARLLDESKNPIAGSTQTLPRSTNVLQTVSLPVSGSPRYINVFATASAAYTGIVGFQVNGKLLSQRNVVNNSFDLLKDAPQSNYSTFAPNYGYGAQAEFTDANLTSRGAADVQYSYSSFVLTPEDTGKYYLEYLPTSVVASDYPTIFFCQDTGGEFGSAPNTYFYLAADGELVTIMATKLSGTEPAFNNFDIVGILVDLQNDTVEIKVNGQDGVVVQLDNREYVNVALQQSTNAMGSINYGQQPFQYAPDNVQGFVSDNLPKPAIIDGSAHHQTITGPGQGGYGLYYELTDTDFNLGIEDMTFLGVIPGNNVSAQQFICDCFDLVDSTSFTISNGWGWLGGNAQVYVSADGSNGSWTMVNNDQTMGNDETVTVSHSSPFRYFKLNYKIVGTVNFGDITSTNAPILERAQSLFPNGLWWIKDRVNAQQHQLVDSINGTSCVRLPASTAPAEYVVPTGDSVAWCWSAPDSWTDASIDTGYRNVTAGFSMFTYTGDGTNSRDIAHGLGKAPDCVIIFDPEANDVNTYIRGLEGTGDETKNLVFNTAEQAGNVFSAGIIYAPDSPTTFTVGLSQSPSNTNGVNKAGTVYRCYCWTTVPGYSQFGTYVGNGQSPKGTYTHMNFQPSFMITKPTDTGDWRIYDTTRSPWNPVNSCLKNATTQAEETGGQEMDWISTGVRNRDNGSPNNGAGTEYAYMAFAKHPFKYSNAR